MNETKQIPKLKSKKIFILLPDGIGLRNFAFTSFVEIGEKNGWEVVFWNQTPFDLAELGFNELKLKGKIRPFTDLIKRAKINAGLDLFEKKFKDKVYQTYKFPSSKKGLKSKFKDAIVNQLMKTSRGEEGQEKLRDKLKTSERKSAFYRKCFEILQKEKPDFIFCTNQRPVTAISPLTAAQDLGILTGTFIFSWDNLPKATMVVEPDFYFVWSKYMKDELLNYYPYIDPKNVFITGSPQFEPHFNTKLRKSREEFFEENDLDLNKEYICFSGDDITSSPDDPQYLQNVAEAIENINIPREPKLNILFRRCPVDFSERYNTVLEKFKDIIVPVVPKWKQVGENWNSVLPTQEDVELQINTILHSKAVINVGSSMVFDFAIFNKPCMFLHYNVDNKKDESWSIEKVYNFVHLRSMSTRNEVIWLNSEEEIKAKLEAVLHSPEKTVAAAKDWLARINLSPADKASERIWNVINKIEEKRT